MLHESFGIWYYCLQRLRDTDMQKPKYFERFCEDCDDYYKLCQDAPNVHQNGDAVFTREHLETLSSYLHDFVKAHLKHLRRDCPEWAFILSEFHNFVIEHEMQKLQVGWVEGGVGRVNELLIRMQSL